MMGGHVRHEVSRWEVVAAELSPLMDVGYVAVPVRGGHSAVHQDVAAGDEHPVRTHQERGNAAQLRFFGLTRSSAALVTYPAPTPTVPD